MFAVMVCTKVLYSTSCSLTESFGYSLHVSVDMDSVDYQAAIMWLGLGTLVH